MVPTNVIDFSCRICSKMKTEPFLLQINSYVTSDCNFWEGDRPEFRICECGYVGKFEDKKYFDFIQKAYKKYNPYATSGGIEQFSLNNKTEVFQSRSENILNYLITNEFFTFDKCLKILEYGCGNGPFISALRESDLKNYLVDAADVSNNFEAELRSNPNFRKFYNLEFELIREEYDLIIMSHVLEHLSNPVEIINSLVQKLSKDGILFIQIPDSEKNPFDFTIADHLSHFNHKNVITLEKHLNLNKFFIVEEVVKKEISIIIGSKMQNFKQKKNVNEFNVGRIGEFFNMWDARLDTLDAIKDICVFGSSIGATWLQGELESRGLKVKFFLDENPNTFRKSKMGAKIIHPNDLMDYIDDEKLILLIPLAPDVVRIILNKFPHLKKILIN
jgi:2-polyprenyl-3-methyl-5-hydroxy-6-metoxy-1,4-benzoquinol methylase